MTSTLDLLESLAEITIAFVAFSAIVASIRLTFGAKLAPFQKLLIHFFTESGMLQVTFALFPIVLYQFWPDELKVATITTWVCFVATAIYLLTYIRRRQRISAPTPLLSMLNIIIWIAWIVVLAITLTGLFWPPSLALIAAYVFWGFFSGTLIFFSFLSSFLEAGDGGDT